MTSYLPHLLELRKRLILSCMVLSSVFLVFFYFDELLYSAIASPLLQQLPKGGHLIATEVTSSFMVPMKLAFITSLFFCMPYLFYQAWAFVAPGLYRNEKKTIFPLLISSLILFYLGTTFAFLVICPMALHFFANCLPPGVVMLTDLRHYLDFVLTVLLGGGIAFQVPIIVFALIRAGVTTADQLIYCRPYVIVAAFVLGMLLTPPDVVSQILLALPMWGLFEIGVFLTKRQISNNKVYALKKQP